MKIKNVFVQGKMNKDVDERLLPNGQYRHAENIRVSNSEGSDVGAIENSLSNKVLTSFDLGANADTIGSYSDETENKVYWFVTSDSGSYILEWDNINALGVIVLADTRTGVDNILNFNSNYLITGVNKVFNTDVNKEMLAWTDGLNPPRIINIETAKTWVENGFNNEDISVIKNPPRFAPTTALTFTSSSLENNMENKFLSFAYRYKYADGFYSALSSFTYYSFIPSKFNLDYQTMENLGMVNAFNAVNIGFETGTDKVTDVEIFFKESLSNTVYLIERFNKEEQGWADDTTQSYTFSNNKTYTALSDNEFSRTYDNVPLKAQAQELIGNRLMYGNYTEGYDMINVDGDSVLNDYTLAINSEEVIGTEVPVDIFEARIRYDFTGIPLTEGKKLTFDMNLDSVLLGIQGDGDFVGNFQFILNRDFVNAADLYNDIDFQQFVQDVWTNAFTSGYTVTPPDDSTVIGISDFLLANPTTNTFDVYTPVISYQIDDTPADPFDNNFHTELMYWWYNATGTSLFIGQANSSLSIKSNRSLEVGFIYMDSQGRKSTVETTPNNTVYIDSEFSNFKNSLQVEINHKPPVWADRYKIAVKESKGEYQTIFANTFYEDGVYRWVKIEGANVNKVAEGDTLIVKSDLGGVVDRLVKTRVLEITSQPKDFIEGNTNASGDDIIEFAGNYMKIKPVGFDMSFSGTTAQTFEGSSHLRYPVNTYTEPEFGVTDGSFTPFPLNAGSSVNIFIEFEARGSISYLATYDKSFIVNGDYLSVEDWFNAEVGDLGQFGIDYTRDGNGFGFDTNGERFFVRAHRDGTASRKITTTVRFEILFSDGTVIFETEPVDVIDGVYYETEETFEILNGNHQGNSQNQDVGTSTPAIIDSGFFNCYVFPNGTESYRYKDVFNSNALGIDLRPSSISIERYSQIDRFADITYSEPYNENTNVNGLNVFNLATVNYKEDLDKKYGSIQKLYSRDTNLMVFQEDKVSTILFNKDVLVNADGTSNVTSSELVLGQQVSYTGEYGISKNPESFAFFGNKIWFTDTKRGVVLRFGGNGIEEISEQGMRDWFRDKFRANSSIKNLGAYDPYFDQYSLSMIPIVTFAEFLTTEQADPTTITFDEKVLGWTSFHSYTPDWSLKLNNSFYTIKDGQLYIHNDATNSVYNTFYGTAYDSKMSFIFNEEPSDIKSFKTLNLEGTSGWDAVLTTNMTNGAISRTEFIEKESEWYSHIRRTEDSADYSSLSTQGIGLVVTSTGATSFSIGGEINASLANGDEIYKFDPSGAVEPVLELVGVCTSHTSNEITVDALVNAPDSGDMIVFAKNSRVESSMLRGYYMRVDLTYTLSGFVELFAVNSEVFKSYE